MNNIERHTAVHKMELWVNQKVFTLFKTQNLCGKCLPGLKTLARILLKFKPQRGSYLFYAFEKFTAVYTKRKIYARLNPEVWNEYKYLQNAGITLMLSKGNVIGQFVR